MVQLLILILFISTEYLDNKIPSLLCKGEGWERESYFFNRFGM